MCSCIYVCLSVYTKDICVKNSENVSMPSTAHVPERGGGREEKKKAKTFPRNWLRRSKIAPCIFEW